MNLSAPTLPLRESGYGTDFARVAESLRREGRLQEAERLCREGLERHPLRLSGYLVHGRCLLDAGRWEEARERFEAALRSDSGCLPARRFLAQIAARFQGRAIAEEHYRTILELDPWDHEAELFLALPSADQNIEARLSALFESTDAEIDALLDALFEFSDEGDFGGTVLQPTDEKLDMDLEALFAETALDEADVSELLNALFEPEEAPATPPRGGDKRSRATYQHPDGMDTGAHVLSSVAAPAHFETPETSKADPESPEEDEDLGQPREIAANVATVTLAEIYFQQGLKEQALQIYRRLLEREPGNESVRGRIRDIEAARSPEMDRQDHRPGFRVSRPGLKIPKRKTP